MMPRIADRIRRIDTRMQELGAGPSSLIAGSATPAQMEQLQQIIQRPLAPGVRQMLLTHAALKLHWSLLEPFCLPSKIVNATMANVNLSLDGITSAEQSRRNWVQNAFGTDSWYDSIWQAAFGLQNLPNGDLIGVMPSGAKEGAVIYLSHEGDDMHGVIISPTLESFIEEWSRIGFCGPEAWVLQPFRNPDTGFISGDEPEAKLWRATMRLDTLL